MYKVERENMHAVTQLPKPPIQSQPCFIYLHQPYQPQPCKLIFISCVEYGVFLNTSQVAIIPLVNSSISIWKVYVFILFWERKRARGGGEWFQREREREKENPKQAPCYQCRAPPGSQTHEPWDHDLSRIKSQRFNRLSHPGALW